MQISDTWASLLVSALRDAVRYNEQLLNSETLRDRADYEEHLLHVSTLFEYVKDEYSKLDPAGRIPLEKLL